MNWCVHLSNPGIQDGWGFEPSMALFANVLADVELASCPRLLVAFLWESRGLLSIFVMLICILLGVCIFITIDIDAQPGLPCGSYVQKTIRSACVGEPIPWNVGSVSRGT